MSGSLQTLNGTPAWVCDIAGPALDGERAAVDIIGDAYGSGARIVVVPLSRLSPDFLTLSTRIAGDAIQKFVNYGLKVAFVGDVSARVAAGGALADFVRESNQGRHVLFVADMAELEERIGS